MRSQLEHTYRSRNVESEPFKRRENQEMESHYISSRKASELRSPLKSTPDKGYEAGVIHGRGGLAENSSPCLPYEKYGSASIRKPVDRTPSGQPRFPPPRLGHSKAVDAIPVAPGSLLIVDPDDDVCSEMTESVWMSPSGNMVHQRFQPSADMLAAVEDDASGEDSVLTPNSYKVREETARKTTASSSEAKFSAGNTQQADPPLVSSYYARRRLQQQQQQGRPTEDVRDEIPTKLSRDVIDRRLRTTEESVGSRSASERLKEQVDLGKFDLDFQRNRAEEPVSGKVYSTPGSSYSHSRGFLEEGATSSTRRNRLDDAKYDKDTRNAFSQGKERTSPSISDRLEERDSYQVEDISNCRPPRNRTPANALHESLRERDTHQGDYSSPTRSPATSDKLSNVGSRSSSLNTASRSCNASPSTLGISSKDFSTSRESSFTRDNERPDIRSITSSQGRNLSFSGQDLPDLRDKQRDLDEHSLRRSVERRISNGSESPYYSDDVKNKESEVKRQANKLLEQEREIKKLSDLRIQNEAKHDAEVNQYHEILEASRSERDDLKRQLSDVTRRLKEYEVKDYDLKAINGERHKMEEHYQQVIENMERQLAIYKDDLENEKQLQYEKMKDIENQYQSENGRYQSTIRALEDEVSRKVFEISELRAKEKESEELLRSKEESVRQRMNLEKELASVNKQCFEANELVKEMEVSLRNQRHMAIQYEKELGKMENDLQDYKMQSEKLDKEARYYQSKLDESQAAVEKLQRQVDYEKDQRQALKGDYEVELDRCKRQNEDIVQSYEKDRKEILFKVRVLEDAAAEDRMIIDGLRKQLRKYQMGQI